MLFPCCLVHNQVDQHRSCTSSKIHIYSAACCRREAWSRSHGVREGDMKNEIAAAAGCPIRALNSACFGRRLREGGSERRKRQEARPNPRTTTINHGGTSERATATAATECTAECTTDRRDVVVYLFFSFPSRGHSDNPATFSEGCVLLKTYYHHCLLNLGVIF